MILTLFIILLAVTILIMLISIIRTIDVFWDSTLILTDVILWFILAASVIQLEMPYIAILNDNTIVSGVEDIITESSIYLSYLFELFAIIMIIYWVKYVFGPAFFSRFFPNRERFKRS